MKLFRAMMLSCAVPLLADGDSDRICNAARLASAKKIKITPVTITLTTNDGAGVETYTLPMVERSAFPEGQKKINARIIEQLEDLKKSLPGSLE